MVVLWCGSGVLWLCCGGAGGRVGVVHTTPHTAKAAPVVECSTALAVHAGAAAVYIQAAQYSQV